MQHYANRRKYLLSTLVVLGVFLALLFAVKHFTEQSTMSAQVISTGGSQTSPEWVANCMETVVTSSSINGAQILPSARTRVSDCAYQLSRRCTHPFFPPNPNAVIGAAIIGAQSEEIVTEYSYGFFFPFMVTYTVIQIEQEVKCNFLPGYVPPSPSSTPTTNTTPITAPPRMTAPTGTPATNSISRPAPSGTPATNRIIR